MLVVVKKPHIEIKGKVIPAWIIGGLRESYGKNITVTEEKEDLVNIRETAWYKEISAKITPGDRIRAMRLKFGLTQTELAKMIGEIPKQHVSNMETGQRGISKDMAKKLAEIFKTTADKFI